MVLSDLSPMIWSSKWCLLTYLANIGSFPFEWIALLSSYTSTSGFGCSSLVDIGSGPSDSVETSSVASKCDSSSCSSVWTSYNLVIEDLGVEDSWLTCITGTVSGSMKINLL